MSANEDNRMLQELVHLAQVYVQRGQFDMAQKIRNLALAVQARIHRSGSNVVSMSEWSEEYHDENKQA